MSAQLVYAVSHVERLDLTFAPKPWAFAEERRPEIDAYFAALKRDKPHLWNGRVLMLYDYDIAGGVMRGRFLETDFASFTAWGEWGCPPAGAWGCLGAAAVVSADGAYLLGEMSPHSAAAGRVYFPCGMPDQDDVFDGKVDLAHNVARELMEETGLGIGALTAEPGWTMVRSDARVVLFKVVHAPDKADALRGRVLEYLAREDEPELSAIRMVRAPADHIAQMPDFVRAFLAHRGC